MTIRKELAVQRRDRTRFMKHARAARSERSKTFWLHEAKLTQRRIVELKRRLSAMVAS